MPPLTQHSAWPDGIDLAATLGFLGLVFGILAIGYGFMVADFRAYLRSLRRALVLVSRGLRDIPEWARVHTPPCITAFGLRLPCTAEDVKHAYRRRVKRLHPDRGGDARTFQLLQKQFEEALRFLAEE